MVYVSLRKEMPRLSRQKPRIPMLDQRRVVTISLLTPPLSYRLRDKKVPQKITLFF